MVMDNLKLFVSQLYELKNNWVKNSQKLLKKPKFGQGIFASVSWIGSQWSWNYLEANFMRSRTIESFLLDIQLMPILHSLLSIFLGPQNLLEFRDNFLLLHQEFWIRFIFMERKSQESRRLRFTQIEEWNVLLKTTYGQNHVILKSVGYPESVNFTKYVFLPKTSEEPETPSLW